MAPLSSCAFGSSKLNNILPDFGIQRILNSVKTRKLNMVIQIIAMLPLSFSSSRNIYYC